MSESTVTARHALARLRPSATLLVCVVLATTTAGCQRSAPAAPPRRVVLISIDTLRPDHLGAYGYARPTSPHLDALAKDGVLFQDVTSSAPWTLPAHASMLTGLYPNRHGLTSHDVKLAATIPTLATLFAAHGFTTAAVVNSHNLSPSFGLQRDFQKYLYVPEVAQQRAPSSAITDQAKQWLQETKNQPLFLFVHYYDVHSDYRSLPQYEEQFVRPYHGPADGSTAQLIAQRAGKITFDDADVRHLIDLYDAGIRQMDDELAKIVDALGGLDDTLLIVTSDHGEEFLEHGGVLHGRTQFEELVRIPLVMLGAGLPKGARVAAPVSLVDLVPTILGIAAIPAPTGLDGVDLAPTWRGGGREIGERYLLAEADHNNADPDVTRAVRHHSDKLHVDRTTDRALLFDLTTDPGEHHDVAAQHADLVADLRAALARFPPLHLESGNTTMTPEQLERLRSLGYVR